MDAIATWAPYIDIARSRFAPEATLLIRTPAYTSLSLLGAQPQTLVDKHATVQRLVNALVRAEDYIVANSTEALQLVIDHFVTNQVEALRQDWSELQLQVRLDHVTLSTLTTEGAWLARRVNPSPTVPDYRTAFATEFLEAARPQSVTVSNSGG